MLAGRNALADTKIAVWADEGEAWLNEKFKGSGLVFHTSWSVADRTITLKVGRLAKKVSGGLPTHWEELLFAVTEKAEHFVSHLTVTKILMVM